MNSTVQNETAERTSRTMMYTMPLMSLWIGFIMPAGLCVYWIANNLLSMIQEFVAGKMLKKDYEAARVAAEERAQREKEEEKQRKVQAMEERARRLEEEKKNRGKKKPEKKKDEATPAGINKADSQVGIRAYARGRSYDPSRFGGVTEYRDPSAPIREDAVEEARRAKGLQAEAEPDTVETEAMTQETALPPALEEQIPTVPLAEEDQTEETEEIEVEVDEDEEEQEGVQ